MLPVGVLALQGDFREHLHMLEQCGAETKLVRTPKDLAAVSALVVPGGESTAISKLAHAFEVMEPIRERITSGLPVYGSCAGMIMLATEIIDARSNQESFGGIEMRVRRNAFGRQVDSFEASLHAPKITDEPFTAVFIRAPLVEEVFGKTEVLARVETGIATGAVVAVQSGAVIATSFHPELTSDLRIHKYFLELAKSA